MKQMEDAQGATVAELREQVGTLAKAEEAARSKLREQDEAAALRRQDLVGAAHVAMAAVASSLPRDVEAMGAQQARVRELQRALREAEVKADETRAELGEAVANHNVRSAVAHAGTVAAGEQVNQETRRLRQIAKAATTPLGALQLKLAQKSKQIRQARVHNGTDASLVQDAASTAQDRGADARDVVARATEGDNADSSRAPKPM
jgi:hypothetical protein